MKIRCRHCAEYEAKATLDENERIGELVPAVLTAQWDSLWGSTSVPQDRLDWWRMLPYERNPQGKPYYVVATLADQTWVYLDEEGGTTVVHKDAKFFDSVTDASSAACRESVRHAIFLKDGGNRLFPVDWDDERILNAVAWWVEHVPDKEEFMSREDTW